MDNEDDHEDAVLQHEISIKDMRDRVFGRGTHAGGKYREVVQEESSGPTETAKKPSGDDSDERSDSDSSSEDESTNVIDLNVGNLEKLGLEDVELNSHRESARDRYRAQEKKMSQQMRLEDLRTQYLTTMNKMSKLIRKLDDHLVDDVNIMEDVFSLTKAQEALSNGRKAVGYGDGLDKKARANISIQAVLKKNIDKTQSIAVGYEKTYKMMDETKKSLFVVRRVLETFGDGVINLAEMLDESRRRMKEYLALAVRAENIRLQKKEAKKSVPSEKKERRPISAKKKRSGDKEVLTNGH